MNVAVELLCVKSWLEAWRTLGVLLLAALILPLSVLAETPAQVDRLTQQWLDIERQSSLLQSEWKAQQPVLAQRLILFEAEKKQLQALLNQSSASEGDVDSHRAELLSEQAELEQQQVQLNSALTQLVSRLEGGSPMLPPPLSLMWKDEQSALSDDSDVSQQLQVALAQLTHLADFDQRVSVHESTVNIEGGNVLLVKQMYLGVGIAWFVSRDGQYAGWGRVSDGRWEWRIDASVNANAVSNAIATFERRQTAALVRLPVQLGAQL